MLVHCDASHKTHRPITQIENFNTTIVRNYHSAICKSCCVTVGCILLQAIVYYSRSRCSGAALLTDASCLSGVLTQVFSSSSTRRRWPGSEVTSTTSSRSASIASTSCLSSARSSRPAKKSRWARSETPVLFRCRFILYYVIISCLKSTPLALSLPLKDKTKKIKMRNETKEAAAVYKFDFKRKR